MKKRTKTGRRPWSARDLKTLTKEYADTPTKDLAYKLGRSEAAIYGRADLMGLKKSAAYLASPAACRLRRGDNIGASSRFLPRHVPANKGLRRPGWSPGRMAETQFKPGGKPHTWRPIGSVRVTKDGYLQRKINDSGYPPRDWVGVHILNWQEIHGPVPKGFAVAFKDRNKTHTDVSNLELISRRDLMQRNTIHNYPPELTDTIRLVASLERRLRRIDEKHTQ